MPDAKVILQDVLSQYGDANKWIGQPFERIKRLSNTKVGDIGQDFVEKLCSEIGFACEFPLNPKGNRSRTEAWDVRIEGITFELKTATEDVSGAFQFNHIRHHRSYEALLCIGIAPGDIFMYVWTKAEVATGKAGRLATMDKGSSATFKLTMRRTKLQPIEKFKDLLMEICTAPSV